MNSRVAAYELAAGSVSFEGLRRTVRLQPVPAARQVLVRLRAASLNYRDIAIASNCYFPGPIERDTIPLSDGAGEVEAVGCEVVRFSPGDRVVAAFKQRGASLGVPLDGTLTEYAVFDEDGLVPVPECLSYEEAATLPVAGVAAWNGLCEGRRIRNGETMLTLGTGGVSLFAIQLAKASGARVIVTSSSDERLERAKRVGADEVINSSLTPNWESIVLELTGGAGVEQVMELYGGAALAQAFAAVAEGGEIALIAEARLASREPLLVPTGKGAAVRRITCDDNRHLGSLSAEISRSGIKPVIDSVYPFDRAIEAYHEMRGRRHVGKIVITMHD